MKKNNYTMYLSKRFGFSSAHSMAINCQCDKKNKEQFQKCFNIHGHNYQLEATFEVAVSDDHPFPVNVCDLAKIIKDKIIDKVDHGYLNKDIAFFKNRIPSLENIAIYLWEEIIKYVDFAKLYKIKVNETDNNYVEYYGEKK